MQRSMCLLVFFALITIVFGTMYTIVQQSLRLGANEEPTALAEVYARDLAMGATPSSLVFGATTVVPSDARVFAVVYTADGKPVVGSALMEGVLPQVPVGVVARAHTGNEDDVTWQTKSGDRYAVVAIPVPDSNFVVVGAKSLTFTEHLIDHMTYLTGFGYLLTLVLGVATTLIWDTRKRT